MVEQEAVNFEVAGSSPAAGANKITSAFTAGVILLFAMFGFGLATRQLAGDGRGSIPRSGAGKFTFLNAPMVYLDSPAAGNHR